MTPNETQALLLIAIALAVLIPVGVYLARRYM